jgi:hypothetical protein
MEVVWRRRRGWRAESARVCLPCGGGKRIEHSSSEESLGASNRTSSGGLKSAWNAGTTYEEKNITDRAKKLLSEIIAEINLEGAVLEVSDIKGEIHAHCVRGKVKIGYEIESLELTSDDDVTLQIDDLDSTDPEGFSVVTSGKYSQKSVKKFVELMSDLSARLLAE